MAKTHTVNDRPTGILETHMVAQCLPLLAEALPGGAVEGAKLCRSALHGNMGERCGEERSAALGWGQAVQAHAPMTHGQLNLRTRTCHSRTLGTPGSFRSGGWRLRQRRLLRS